LGGDAEGRVPLDQADGFAVVSARLVRSLEEDVGVDENGLTLRRSFRGNRPALRR
jgi:hypothetical protein